MYNTLLLTQYSSAVVDELFGQFQSATTLKPHVKYCIGPPRATKTILAHWGIGQGTSDGVLWHTGVLAAAPLGPVCWGLGLYGSECVFFCCMSYTQGSPSLGAKT